MAFVTPVLLSRPVGLSRSSILGVRISSLPVTARRPSPIRMQILPVFTQAMADYKKEYPAFAERGWGATVKAERWNGRHAMFGFLVLVLTGYCKGQGLIPDAATPLDLSQWGVIGSLGDTTPITTERAVILVAHIHVLLVSVCAALAPFSFQDKLLLEPGEADEAPAGLYPPFEPGLTKGAELWNSRVAMLGLMVLIGCSVATHTSILDTLNIGLGNILY